MDPPTYPFEETSFMNGPLAVNFVGFLAEAIWKDVSDLIAKSVGVLGIMVLLCNKHCDKKFDNANLKLIATHNLVQ